MARLFNKRGLKFISFLIVIIILLLLIFYKFMFSQTKDLINNFRVKFAGFYSDNNIDKALPFRKGESFLFIVKLGFLPIGNSQLIFEGREKLEKKEIYLIKFITNTYNFTDTETIYAQPASFLPLKIERDIRLFRRKIKIIEDYDQEKKLVKITRTEANKTTEQTIMGEKQFDNVLCLLYFYRLPENLEVGKKMSIYLPLNKFEVTVKEIKKVKVPKGKFDAFILESEPKGYSFWFDTSNTRIPLSIDGAIKFGNATMVLTDFH